MKRLISILLAFVLLLTAILPVQAKEVLPIIFVTGIGQTWTHILNTDGSFRSNDPNDKKTYNYFWDDDDPIDYNLLYPDTNGLKTPKAMAASVTVVTQLLLSALLDCDLVSKRAVQTVLTAVLICFGNEFPALVLLFAGAAALGAAFPVHPKFPGLPVLQKFSAFVLLLVCGGFSGMLLGHLFHDVIQSLL